jgi:hypothetical protein
VNPLGFRERADRWRLIPLASVLRLWGAQPDRYDRGKWHTPRGAFSITGAKFMNWSQGVGGGGAIDLVMHLNQAGFKEALQWLERSFPLPLSQAAAAPPRPDLRLPSSQSAHRQRVKRYLIQERALPATLIDRLIEAGTLYADGRANAVFLLRGKLNVPVGAELRGTGPSAWRGMAPGSQKDLGFFSVSFSELAAPTPSPDGLILCESAIDAISCLVLHPQHRCLSTSGARPDPRWLLDLIHSGSPVFCGFDTDATGEAMAQAMIALHPTVQRLRPARHDWNDTLRSHP